MCIKFTPFSKCQTGSATSSVCTSWQLNSPSAHHQGNPWGSPQAVCCGKQQGFMYRMCNAHTMNLMWEWLLPSQQFISPVARGTFKSDPGETLPDYSSNQASQCEALERFNVLKPHIWNSSLLAFQSQFCSNPKGNLIYSVEIAKYYHRTNLSEFIDSWHFYPQICFQVWSTNKHWEEIKENKRKKKQTSKFNSLMKPSSHRQCLPVTWDTRRDSLLCVEPAVFLWKTMPDITKKKPRQQPHVN